MVRPRRATLRRIPFADEKWGRTLLARGQPDAAIAKFTLSNQKGPHFADPLEGWGEALMAKKQPDAALAIKIAGSQLGAATPVVGQALAEAGRKDEAKTQFDRVAQLDMTAAEKAELAEINRG